MPVRCTLALCLTFAAVPFFFFSFFYKLQPSSHHFSPPVLSSTTLGSSIGANSIPLSTNITPLLKSFLAYTNTQSRRAKPRSRDLSSPSSPFFGTNTHRRRSIPPTSTLVLPPSSFWPIVFPTPGRSSLCQLHFTSHLGPAISPLHRTYIIETFFRTNHHCLYPKLNQPLISSLI